MASTQPLVFRWGIIATGRISGDFVKDLLVDPTTRGTTDVVHKVAAVGSRSVESAQKFIQELIAGDSTVKAYGSYAEVYNDPDVDAIYIGTPHTMHYINAKDAIIAKKHVLCEKPVTSNAAELKSLLALAQEHGVFFMEAMWTRFQPLVKEVKRIMDEGSLGPVNILHADLSGDFDIENIPKTHRMLDPNLGGGAILDLGPYPLVWAILALFEDTKNDRSAFPGVSGAMLKTPRTGVDASTAFTLTFPTISAQAILSCSMTLPEPALGATIRFRQGNILIAPPIYRPMSFTVQWFDKPGSGKIVKEEKRSFEYVGSGWHFQADEVARCVREGKTQSDLWGHEKSLLAMRIFDEVRKQGGYTLPDGVEHVV
ncbi:NAD(P)-binding protein [Punctularia strigosozonata HHB-11173 SS5]|uniref:NAD(P)-binding protein n=1 Tax=Punctularia strigosozonata (strain HHB-11173) TaxID=741275 RepID=UPI00044163B3|nr:NAD(P)-binding protein [Punctularia strigosozonata HHB-11173 SS5]EIN06157.1 NAD(P)-binding protein [Punctularia strigosozonata HHB-11173 SS5]